MCRKPASKIGTTFGLCVQEQMSISYKKFRADCYYFISCHNSKVLQIFHTGEHVAVLCKLLTTVNLVNSLFVLFRAQDHFLCHSSCVCVCLRYWLIITMQEENNSVITQWEWGVCGEQGLGEINCHATWRAWIIYVAASFDKRHLSSCQLYWLTKQPLSVTFYLSF